jgi:hypothetical protein
LIIHFVQTDGESTEMAERLLTCEQPNFRRLSHIHATEQAQTPGRRAREPKGILLKQVSILPCVRTWIGSTEIAENPMICEQTDLCHQKHEQESNESAQVPKVMLFFTGFFLEKALTCLACEPRTKWPKRPGIH